MLGIQLSTREVLLVLFIAAIIIIAAGITILLNQ